MFHVIPFRLAIPMAGLLRFFAVLKLKDQLEVVDGLSDILRTILVLVPTNVLHDIPLHVIEAIFGDVLNWLNNHAFVVLAAFLRV
jgi:hypothetical protein